MVNILVNAITCNVGGGMQVTLSCLDNWLRIDDQNFNFLFLVHEKQRAYLPKDLKNHPSIIFFKNKQHHFLYGFSVKRKILLICKNFNPDIVYSIGFPSFIKFDCPELGRYTNPLEIMNIKYTWYVLNLFERVRLFFKTIYLLYQARKADIYETQTQVAKRGIINKLNVSADSIIVYPNVLNDRIKSVYNNEAIENNSKKKFKSRTINIFTLAADYPTKNLPFIAEVAKVLNERSLLNFKFTLSIDVNSDSARKIRKKFSNSKLIKNFVFKGKLSLEKAAHEYYGADLFFLPTLAEVYSVSFLEAMYFKLPIITSDLDFLREVCQNAASYYSPLDAEDASIKILEIISNNDVRLSLLKAGKEIITKHPSSNSRSEKILEYLKKYSK